MDDDTYELAKMAATQTARGEVFGWLLKQAAIKRAGERGMKKVFLESNTILEPAINL